MADYCTVDNIRSMMKSITISDVTKITTTEVETWITNTSALIDSKVIRQYSLPVTDSGMLAVLKSVCEMLVAARIVRVLYAGSMKNVPAVAREWKKEAMDILNEIAEGKVNADATGATDIVFTGKNDSDGETREPVFDSDEDSW